ncbi:response regulator [Galbibacter sp.]|uniref:response regulator n=1 Tax=Galbibacter sp. TaxID=2918471 RepID=UPI003A8E7ACC
MKKHYKTLIVDDHALLAEGIVRTLMKISNSTGSEFNTHSVHNLGDALAALKTKPSFDLVFLDINLEPQPEIGMYSGEDLGVEIRKRYPGTLIIVSTIYNDFARIKNIFGNVKPDGFLVKGDLNGKKIVSAIKDVLNETPFFSKTVLKCLSNNLDTDIRIASLDRQLLFELEKGLTMEKIAENLLVSRTTVFNWKGKLKIIFGVEGGSDKDLLDKARELNFI